ncbi:tyrosinase family oxidase copper chaperone [Streptomyces sp. NPDC048389]|uniref:tyrosinase family oxidase copper chaperone n=1 Tax=Streptomyces sp. NPDC048389 TaxID=3154622 RepID=UPI0034559041
MSTPAVKGGKAAEGGFVRRQVLRALFTVTVVAGTAGALVPVLTRRAQGVRDAAGPNGPAATRPLERFAEMYRGRHIQGSATVMVPADGGDREGGTTADTADTTGTAGGIGEGVADGTAGDRVATVRPAGGARLVPSVEVRIDGRPLHVMRRADGTYLSLVNHYESFPTLRDVARAAVDELGDAQLSLTPMHSV